MKAWNFIRIIKRGIRWQMSLAKGERVLLLASATVFLELFLREVWIAWRFDPAVLKVEARYRKTILPLLFQIGAVTFSGFQVGKEVKLAIQSQVYLGAAGLSLFLS